MNYAQKKLVVVLLTVSMIFTFSIPSFAASNDKISNIQLLNSAVNDDTSVNFLEISDTKVIYTYERNGEIYKNIDTIVSQNTVDTDVYLLKNGVFTHIDSMTSVINFENASITTDSSINGKSTCSLSFNANASTSKWVKTYDYNGDTQLRNESVTAIAIFLGALIGGGAGAFMATAAFIFDKKIKTVYYHVIVYKDKTSNIHNPIFKHVSYFYRDAAHTDPLPHNPVTSIVKR